MKIRTDLAVVGAGFAGSLLSLIARRLGLSVALIERGSHPRFAIGESSSPLANLLLESLSDRYGLRRIRPLAKWGTWRRAYPGIACGLKRGFTFYAHGGDGTPWSAGLDREDQLMVAASPRDEIADTHWYRPDFDEFLAGEAQAAGALYFDRTRLTLREIGEDGAKLEGERPDGQIHVCARLVVDASGPRGFLHRALDLPESAFEAMPSTVALYTHFRGVERIDEMGIVGRESPPPYPPDDAAMHHVFPRGWIWVLRFDNGITSAGVAATEALARELGFSDGAASWARLLDRLPTVRDQFGDAQPVLPFVHHSPLPFRAGRAAGPGWALLPSAAAFVDPLLSTGFPLTLLGIERLARALENDWGTPRLSPALERHAERTLFEADAAALLIAALYACLDDFPLFCGLSKLYFAAASYSEACRRLSRLERAGSFLCADRPDFGAALSSCCRRAIALERSPANGSARRKLLGDLARAIEPIDVAGLSDRKRRNWFPVLAEDLRASAAKLGATEAEVDEMLTRCRFSASAGNCASSSSVLARQGF